MIAKRILLAVTAILAALVLVLVGVAGMDNTAQAQGTSLKPTNVRAVNGPNAGEVTLSWTPGANATTHKVAYRKRSGGNWQFRQTSGNASGLTISGLAPGIEYWFTVAAGRGAAGSELWSSWWTDANGHYLLATASGGQRPGDVRNLRAAPGPNAGEATLNWTPGANATVHQVAYKMRSGGDWQLRRTSGNASGLTISGLVPGQQYWFTVRAGRGAAGSELWSSWWTDASSHYLLATASGGQRPGDVTGLKATPGGAGAVILSWNPGANATAHQVYYTMAGSSSWKLWSSTLAGNANGTTVTGLTAGTRYQFAVRALRGEAGSEWALAYATAGQEQRPGNATNLTARPSNKAAGDVILSWTPGANATVHVVAFKKANGSEFRTQKFWDDASSMTIHNLEVGQDYNFWVIAGRGTSGSEAWSLWSNPATAAPASQDRVALVHFYNATGGGSWKSNTNWGSDNLSEWDGVTTDGKGRVTEINLSDNNLRGNMPASLPYIESFESLTELNLAENRMEGSIPSWVNQLAELTKLNLSENADRGKFGRGEHSGFSGELPMEMGELHNLRYLDLSGNSFVGDPTKVLLNIVQCEKNNACRDEDTFIDIDLRDNSWSQEKGADFWRNFAGKVVQVARGEFGDPYKNFIGKNADSVIKAFLNHEALAGKYSRFNAWATITEGAIGKANFAAEIVDPLGLFGQDATVQTALWDVFILNKDWTEVGTAFLTSWGVAPENICWGGLVSANCRIYESLDSAVEWCKAIYGERAVHCNQ